MSFTARYPGTCVECGWRFQEGAEIRFTDDDELAHAGCSSETEGEGDPCPRCFMVPAVNGRCGCE